MVLSRFGLGRCCCNTCDWFSTGLGLASTNRPVEAFSIWQSEGSVEQRVESTVYYTGPTPYPPDAGSSDVSLGTTDLSGSGELEDDLLVGNYSAPNGVKFYEDNGTFQVTTTPRTDATSGERTERSRTYWVFTDHQYQAAVVFKYTKGDEWPSGSINYFNGVVGNGGSIRPDTDQIFEPVDGLDDVVDSYVDNEFINQVITLQESRPTVGWFDLSLKGPSDNTLVSSKASYAAGGLTGLASECKIEGGDSGEFWCVITTNDTCLGYRVNSYDSACYALDNNETHSNTTPIGNPLGVDENIFTFYNLPTDQEYTFDAPSGKYVSTKNVFDGMHLRVTPHSNLVDFPGLYRSGDVIEYGYQDAEGVELFKVTVSIERLPDKYQLPIDYEGNFTSAQLGLNQSGFRTWHFGQIPADYSYTTDAGARWIASKVTYEIGGESYEAYTTWNIKDQLRDATGEWLPNGMLMYPPLVDLLYRDGGIFTYLYNIRSSGEDEDAVLSYFPPSNPLPSPSTLGVDNEIPMLPLDDTQRPLVVNQKALEIDLSEAYWYVKPGNTFTTVDYFQTQKEPDSVDCTTSQYDGMQYPYAVPELTATVSTLPEDLAPILETHTQQAPQDEFDPRLGTPNSLLQHLIRSESVAMPFGLRSGEYSSEYALEGTLSRVCTRDYPELSVFAPLGPFGFNQKTYNPDESLTINKRVTNEAFLSGALAWEAMPWEIKVTREVVDQTADTVTLDVTVEATVFYQPVGISRPDTAEEGRPIRFISGGTFGTVYDSVDYRYTDFAEGPVPAIPLDQFGTWPPTVEDASLPTPARDLGDYFVGWERAGSGATQVAVYETPQNTVTEVCEDNSDLEDFPGLYADPPFNSFPESKQYIRAEVREFTNSVTERVTITKGTDETLQIKPFELWEYTTPVGNLNPAKPAILDSEPAYTHRYIEVVEESSVVIDETNYVTVINATEHADSGFALTNTFVPGIVLAQSPEAVDPPAGGLQALNEITKTVNPIESTTTSSINELCGWHYTNFTTLAVEVNISGDW